MTWFRKYCVNTDKWLLNMCDNYLTKGHQPTNKQMRVMHQKLRMVGWMFVFGKESHSDKVRKTLFERALKKELGLGKVLYMFNRKTKASGVGILHEDGTFTLSSSAKGVFDDKKSLPNSYKYLRSSYLESKKATPFVKGDDVRFIYSNVNIKFNSLSAAGSFLSGTSVNGKKVWREIGMA